VSLDNSTTPLGKLSALLWGIFEDWMLFLMPSQACHGSEGTAL